MKGINKLEVNKEFFFFGDFDEFVVLILFGLKVNRNKQKYFIWFLEDIGFSFFFCFMNFIAGLYVILFYFNIKLNVF